MTETRTAATATEVWRATALAYLTQRRVGDAKYGLCKLTGRIYANGVYTVQLDYWTVFVRLPCGRSYIQDANEDGQGMSLGFTILDFAVAFRSLADATARYHELCALRNFPDRIPEIERLLRVSP